MKHYAGIDVSLEASSVCVLDGEGRIFREAKVASEPEALIAWFGGLGVELDRIGLEAGPLSQWLFRAMADGGLPVELLESRHVSDALKSMPVKSDRNDARGIAHLIRLGWFRPVHCKSLAAQETRALLTARRLLRAKLHDVEMSIRGILRNFGLKIGRTTWRGFGRRVEDLTEGHATLRLLTQALLTVRSALEQEFRRLDGIVRRQARQDERARLLMSVPGVGPIVSLTYVAAIDETGRFKSSKAAGPHFGLTPKRYQSGETDHAGRISKKGDAAVRSALYEAANVILMLSKKSFGLKSWAQAIASRSGPRKAKVALARKLAVVMHRMLVDQTPYKATA